MKKLLLAIGVMLAVNAYADKEFRYTPNKAGGNIFFTLSYCVYLSTQQRIPNNFYVYSTNETGAKIADGCYVYKYPFYMIEWNGGGRTSIESSSTQPLN